MKEKYSMFFEQLNDNNCFVALTKRNIVKFNIFKDKDGNYWNYPYSWDCQLVNISKFTKDFRKVLNTKPNLRIMDRNDVHQLMCIAVDKRLEKYKSDKNHIIHKDIDNYDNNFSGEYVSVHFKDGISPDFKGYIMALVMTDEEEYDPCYAILDENMMIRYMGLHTDNLEINIIKENIPDALSDAISNNEVELYGSLDKDMLQMNSVLIMF